MLGVQAQQIFYWLIAFGTGLLAAYGAYRYRSLGLATLAFSYLLRFVSGTVIGYYWSEALKRSAALGNAPTYGAVNLLSTISNAASVTLAVAAVVLLLRDFALLRRRLDESEAQVDRLARERMERE